MKWKNGFEFTVVILIILLILAFALGAIWIGMNIHEKRMYVRGILPRDAGHTAIGIKQYCEALNSELRYAGTAAEGDYLKHARCPIGMDGKVNQYPELNNVTLFWMIPPPSGIEFQIRDKDGKPACNEGRARFYVCSAEQIRGARLFLFQFPIGGRMRGHVATQWGFALYTDDEVSWYYQMLMEDLTPQEREREIAYRTECDGKWLPDE